MVDKLIAMVEEGIQNNPLGAQPKSLYEPIRYIMTLGGKRLRPVLTLLSYSMFKSDVQSAVKYAVAVEAFHNFTLMHDDIMDGAPLRRGKPTVHRKWNVSTAILSGDVMLVKVYDLFSSLEGKKFREVVKLFNKCAAGVCEGQQLDMEFELKRSVSEGEYISMIRLKTALLIGFSLELGAVLADAPENERALLREAGIHLGIAFQLKDDLLDVYGSKQKFGKQVGGDIIANKKTFLLIKTLQKARGKEKRELERWLSASKFDRRKKVTAVKNLYDKLKVRGLTESKIAEYFGKAFEGIDELGNGRELLAFARELAGREK